MKKSAIILAGGFSKRLGQEKGLVNLAGKPIIFHVLDSIFTVVDEIIVVVSSNVQSETFVPLLGQRASVVIDRYKSRSPLIGALTGFENVGGEYSLLLPCDTPFISSKIASILLDLCVKRHAVIPRWPNGFIESLQAVYHTKSALNAAKKTLEQNKFDLQSMIACLREVQYISTEVLQQIDPKLLTFYNINTPEDLEKAKIILKLKWQFLDS